MANDFIYANGRISAEEINLLDHRMWQMLISSADEDEVLRLLGDTWYGTFMQYHSMEECFIRAMEVTEEELVQLSEDPRLVRGILHRRDVRNARYIWKQAIFQNETEVQVERPGLLEIETLKMSVTSNESMEELPGIFKQALQDVLEAAESGTAGFDRRMDRLAAEVELEELSRIDSEFLNFVRTRIEQKNFLTAGRCAIDSVPRQDLGDMLLPGGFHSPEEIVDAYQRNDLSRLMAETQGFEEMSAEFDRALEEGSFLKFERESDRRLLELLQKGAFPVFGPSPLASFVIMREMEISHLRLLLAAKSAGVSQDILKSRIPRG